MFRTEYPASKRHIKVTADASQASARFVRRQTGFVEPVPEVLGFPDTMWTQKTFHVQHVIQVRTPKTQFLPGRPAVPA